MSDGPLSMGLRDTDGALVPRLLGRARRFLFAAALAAGCSLAPAPGQAEGVLLFAAASTTDAVDEIIDAYRAAGGERVAASYAGSSALARQIENGAPAHLFISANPLWMAYLAERGLVIVGSRVDRLGNRLALVAPIDSPAATSVVHGFPLGDLLGDGRLAVAEPDHVPAGIYARAALEHLGVWQSVEAKLVRSPNVRAALALVERGETPLGIVYRTDARASAGSRIVALFPLSSHPPIVYSFALVAGGDTPEARAFHDYLLGAAASEIFERHGFVVRQAVIR